MNSMALPRRHRGPKIQHTLLQNLTRREKSLTEGCGNYLGGREGSIRGMTDRLPVQGRADDLDRGSLVLQSARRRRTGARRRSCRARLEPDARSTTDHEGSCEISGSHGSIYIDAPKSREARPLQRSQGWGENGMGNILKGPRN